MDRRVNATDTGFTLIELMIAVMVLALLTTTVSLSVNRPRTTVASDPGRFRAVFQRLHDQAILSRQVLGLAVDGDGFQRLLWDGNAWQLQGAPVRWHGDVVVLRPIDIRVPVQFAPSGQMTPLRLRFGGAEGATICESDGWAGLTCRAG